MKKVKKISKAVWLWLVPLLNCFDVILTRVPMFLFWFFVVECCIYYTDFYAKYYKLLNDFDSFLVFSVVLHALFLGQITKYSTTTKIYCLSILMIILVQLQKAYLNISDENYFRLYKTVLGFTVITILINAFLSKDEDN